MQKLEGVSIVQTRIIRSEEDMIWIWIIAATPITVSILQERLAGAKWAEQKN